MHVPEKLAVLSREFHEGTRTPAEPRNAATVVLLRSGATGPEVYMLRRQVSMEFAGGMAVFPGGGVDPRDFAHDVAWAGPSPEEWATRLAVEPDLARALVCAAVRETFEESGVLLAGKSTDDVVADTTSPDWEADRVALESREVSMTDFLTRRGLVLRTDLLGTWGGWLTPIFESRRYRTWFFVATMPEGQITRDVSSEAASVAWQPVADVLDQAEAGEMAMLPPTYLTCLEISLYGTPSEVLALTADRTVDMFTPSVEDTPHGPALSMPDRLRPLVAERRHL